MAIQILPLLLIGAGAVAIATRKKMGIPIGAKEGRWLKVYPNTEMFQEEFASVRDTRPDHGKMLQNEMLARSIWMKAANTVRTGDVIEVALVPTLPRYYEPKYYEHEMHLPLSEWGRPAMCVSDLPEEWGERSEERPIPTAWYVVTRSPADRSKGKKISNEREVMLEAKLIMGHGPKVWTIYERASSKDNVPPKGSGFATRLYPIKGPGKKGDWSASEDDDLYHRDGKLMFPEIITIGRAKKTIFSQHHRKLDGKLLVNGIKGMGAGTGPAMRWWPVGLLDCR